MNDWFIKFTKTCNRLILVIVCLAPQLVIYGQDNQIKQEEKAVTFLQDILPIFKKNCLRCHSNRLFFFGGLRLNSLEWVRKGGHSGPAVIAYNPQKSPLYRLIQSGRMPPSGNTPLKQEEIQRIEDWIRQGAK